MGQLFGRDAALEVLENNKMIWWMSMVITLDTKETIKNANERMGK